MFTSNKQESRHKKASLKLAKAIKAELGVFEEESELSSNTKKRKADTRAKTTNRRSNLSKKQRVEIPIGEKPHDQLSDEDSWVKLVFAHETFCPAHHDFSNSNEIDHVQPWSSLVDRTNTLLDFLNNKNDVFKQTFLQALPDWFIEDTNNKITVTNEFAKQRDRFKENLFSLCPRCNREKKDISPMDWFEKNPFFGKAFMRAVATAGGLHRGIIFDRVYESSNTRQHELTFSNGQLVELYPNAGEALGVFAKKWWEDNFTDVYLEQHKLRNNIYTDMAGSLKEISYYRALAKDYFEKEGSESEKGKKYEKRAEKRFRKAGKNITSVIEAAKVSLEKRRTIIFSALVPEAAPASDDFYKLLSIYYPELGTELRQKIKQYLEKKKMEESSKETEIQAELDNCLRYMSTGGILPHAVELKALTELTGKLIVVIDNAARVINEKEELKMKESEGEVLFVEHNRDDGTFRVLRAVENDPSHALVQLQQRYRRLSTSTASSTTESTNDDDEDQDLRAFLSRHAHYNAWSITRSHKSIGRLVRNICEERHVKSRTYDLLKVLRVRDAGVDSDNWNTIAEQFETFSLDLIQKQTKVPFVEIEKKLRELFKAESPKEEAKRQREEAKRQLEEANRQREEAKRQREEKEAMQKYYEEKIKQKDQKILETKIKRYKKRLKKTGISDEDKKRYEDKIRVVQDKLTHLGDFTTVTLFQSASDRTLSEEDIHNLEQKQTKNNSFK